MAGFCSSASSTGIELLDTAAEAEFALAGDPDVAHPLGDAARGDQVAAAFEGQQVDRRLAQFAA